MIIHFIRPYWLYALIPVIVYLCWAIHSYRQANPWKNVCDPHLLPALLKENKPSSRLFYNITLLLFFIITIFALAGPAWQTIKLPIYRDVNSLMLVLDLSEAMQTTDLKPDRLTRAKFKIRDLISKAENTQMGLVVFTEEAFVVSPLSQDANTLNALLPELNSQIMPISGSNIGRGLDEGLNLLKQAKVSASHLLLITASEPNSYSWNAAKRIAESGYYLDILAVVKDNNDQATINKLKDLAKIGGGDFYQFTPDDKDIQKIIHSNQHMETIKGTGIDTATEWQDEGIWLCLLLIPLALIILREKMKHEKSH